MPATVSAASPTPSLLTSGEKLYSPATIAKLIPSHRDKAHLNGSTVFRWITKGVRTASGEVIRLEATKCGYYWRTSLEAVERFTGRLTAAAISPTPTSPSSAPTPTPASRKRAAAKASRDADRLFGNAK